MKLLAIGIISLSKKSLGLRSSRRTIISNRFTTSSQRKSTMTTKARTALDEMSEDGAFKRTDSVFRNVVKKGGKFEPEAGRYHLYISLACPWAAGTLATLRYKGLDDGVIGYSIVHPTWGRTRPDDPNDTHCGWHFRNPGDDPVPNALGHGSNECDDACIPDSINGAKTIRDLYELAEDTTGKYSTPVLWDKKEKTIVSNESVDILKAFNSAFDEFAKHPERNIFPSDEKIAKQLDDLNEYIYPNINNGVYRCGFATSQKAYGTAHTELFESLDKAEEHLKHNDEKGIPFLVGDALTWVDLRLYMTLVRFDPVYVVYFKTSFKRIIDYPYLLQFMRKVYAIPEIKASTNIKHIKMHYFTSHPALNTYGIIPESNGPALE